MIRLIKRFSAFVRDFSKHSICGFDGEYVSPRDAWAVAWETSREMTMDWKRHEDNLWLAVGVRNPNGHFEAFRAWRWGRHLKKRAKRLAKQRTYFGISSLLGERESRMRQWISFSESDDAIYHILVRERWMVEEARYALYLRRESEKAYRARVAP